MINAFRLFLVTAVLVFSLPPAAFADDGEESGEAIVVWRLEAKRGVDDKDIDSISGFLAAEVERLSGRKVISEADIQTIVRGEETKQRCGVNDTSCIVEIGSALGVPEAISGDLGRVGSFWMLNLRRINVRKADVIKRSSRQIEGSIDDLIRAMPGAIADLFTDEAAEAAEPPKPAPPKEEIKEIKIEPGTLAVTATPENTSIRINDETAGPTPLEKELLPGDYSVEASLEGYEPEGRNVTIRSQQKIELSFELKKIYPMNPYKKWGFVSLGGGLGLLALAGASTWRAKVTADDYNAGNTDVKTKNWIWSGAAVSGYGLGGAAVITGTVLLILSPGDKEWAERNGDASAAVTTDGKSAFISLSGRW